MHLFYFWIVSKSQMLFHHMLKASWTGWWSAGASGQSVFPFSPNIASLSRQVSMRWCYSGFDWRPSWRRRVASGGAARHSRANCCSSMLVGCLWDSWAWVWESCLIHSVTDAVSVHPSKETGADQHQSVFQYLFFSIQSHKPMLKMDLPVAPHGTARRWMQILCFHVWPTRI